VHLVLVGKGDFDLELKGRVPARHYSLVGWQPHERIGRYVATFDALPLTYGRDMPFYFSPLKLPEAMACGVVPVVPDLGDLGQIVGSGGLVYRPDDLEGLVSTLERLVRNADMRERLAQHARNISAGYSWECVAEFVVRRAAAGRVGRSRDVRSA
jgi:glycosyltransferase involved in cell wall biosynthesis